MAKTRISSEMLNCVDFMLQVIDAGYVLTDRIDNIEGGYSDFTISGGNITPDTDYVILIKGFSGVYSVCLSFPKDKQE